MAQIYISKRVPCYGTLWYKYESVKVCQSKWTLMNVSVNGVIEVNLVIEHMTRRRSLTKLELKPLR